MSNDPFADIRDKRIGELNEEQKDRATEFWLREQIGPSEGYWHPLLKQVFRVIDRLRAPIDMVLHCPKCGMQHIDEPSDDAYEGNPPTWTNPPHRSHLCHGCGHIWRPADVPTNGVQEIKTKGKADSAIVSPTSASPICHRWQEMDEDDPRWHLNAVVDGLLGGDGAYDDHVAWRDALTQAGLAQDIIERITRKVVAQAEAAPKQSSITMKDFESAMRSDQGPLNIYQWTFDKDDSGTKYLDRETQFVWDGWKLAKGIA